MNSLFRLLVVGSLLTAAHTFAADAFEGKVTLAMSGDKGGPQAIDYTIKGHKLRMDLGIGKPESSEAKDQAAANEPPKKSHKLLPGFLTKKTPGEGDHADRGHAQGSGQVTTIMDMDKMEMLMLMPEQNMYMVMPIKKVVDKAMEHAEKNGDLNTQVERTGKTERILGYNCDQILVTDKDRKTITEMWVASGLGTFMGLAPKGGGGGGMFGGHKSAASAKWEEALKGKPGFPLRVVTHDAKDKETFRMEATKIEPGPQPDSLFLPPPGYEKFSMPDLGDLNPFKQG